MPLPSMNPSSSNDYQEQKNEYEQHRNEQEVAMNSKLYSQFILGHHISQEDSELFMRLNLKGEHRLQNYQYLSQHSAQRFPLQAYLSYYPRGKQDPALSVYPKYTRSASEPDQAQNYGMFSSSKQSQHPSEKQEQPIQYNGYYSRSPSYVLFNLKKAEEVHGI